MTSTLSKISTFLAALVCLLAAGGAALAQLANPADASASSVEVVTHVQPEDFKAKARSVQPRPALATTARVVDRQPQRAHRAAGTSDAPKARPHAHAYTPRGSFRTAARISEVEPAATSPIFPKNTSAQLKTAVADGHVDRVVEFARLDEASAKQEAGPGSFKMGASVIVKLAVVLGLAYLTILALKLLSTKRDVTPRGRQELKMLDTVKLSPTSSLHVVDFNGKKMLVGASTGQVNLLREFEEEEAPDAEPVSEGRFAEYPAKYSGPALTKSPAGRVAGMLRDCAAHLRDRGRQSGQVGGKAMGDTHEA